MSLNASSIDVVSLDSMGSAQQQVEETDRLLDELELMARSNATNRLFFDQVLSSLRLLVAADSASIMVLVPPGSWIEMAQSGILSPESNIQFATGCERLAPLSTPAFLQSAIHSPYWFAIPLCVDDFSSGCILLTFARSLPESGLPAIQTIARAFAEVLLVRQFSRVEQLFGREWTRIQQLTGQVADTRSMKEAGDLLANQLVVIFAASRVSLASAWPFAVNRAKVLSVSSALHVDQNSSLIKGLKSIAWSAFSQEQPFLRQEPLGTSETELENRVEADGTFKNLLGLRFQTGKGSKSSPAYVIILEWANREEMLDALPAIRCFMPTLCLTWEQHRRLLKVPKIIRALANGSPLSFVPALVTGMIRPLVMVLSVLLAYWFLSKPYPMRIEAESILEPIARRAVYANVDGFLDRLLVEDGQSVIAGERVADLRSPILDLQIEEANGQIHAIAEKRNGLRVAINQLSPSSSDAEVVQTRLSAEILLLETQEKHVRDKWNFLLGEKKKLSIESPIDGVVVTRNLRSELESRPLRRGDTLFNIVDLDGDWQLSIRVADRDIGYLTKHYGSAPTEVAFLFDSIPGEQFRGVVHQISTTLENPQGTGSFVLVHASLDKEVAQRAYMGANARVFFSCGKEPLWFVWCRPLIEEFQKRIWLFTANDDE